MTNPNLLSAESHFAFGKNWLDYAQKIDEAKIAQAIADLQRLSGRQRFDGLSFLDIGCGSGLHSLAAVRMGAARVVGVDIDADSVAAARGTLKRFAPEADARFDVVSVFDMSPQTHGGFDLVYSWGRVAPQRRHVPRVDSCRRAGWRGGVHGCALQEDAVLRYVARYQALVQLRRAPGAAACPKCTHGFAASVVAFARPQSRRLHPQLWPKPRHGLRQRHPRLDGRLSLRIHQPTEVSPLLRVAGFSVGARVRCKRQSSSVRIAGLGLR